MSGLLYAFVMLYLGLLIGTYIKILPYGLQKNFTLSLAFIVPFLLIYSHTKKAKKFLSEKEYKKSFRELTFPIACYPLCVRFVAEIATEIIARKTVMERIQKQQEIIEPDVNFFEKILIDIMSRLNMFDKVAKTILSVINKKEDDHKYNFR